MGKKVSIKNTRNQFSGREGIITEVDHYSYLILLDIGVEFYFQEGEFDLL